MQWVQHWWQLPDRYEWQTSYLVERGLRHIVQRTMAGITALFSLAATAMMFSDAGPTDTPERTAATCAILIGFVLTGMWLWKWPSRNQSRFFVIAAILCVATAALAQRDPLAGFAGCYCFVVIGGYVAFMHCAKAAAVNWVAAVSVGGVLIWRIGSSGADLVLGTCQVVIIVIFTIAPPIGLNTILQYMATDISQSELDPLTGLLNRRAFYRETCRLVDGCTTPRLYELTISMIDLDNFKQVNDQRGHAAGDQALVTVGRALASSVGPEAVVARAGGEEFLVAELTSRVATSSHMCRVIAATSEGITASVGFASLPIARFQDGNATLMIDGLIRQADTAMYSAKSSGGNRAHQHGVVGSQ